MEPSLSQMAFGYVPAQVLHATVSLGLADALADGPQRYPELAARTGTDPVALRSLLRALVGLGLAEQVDTEQFGLTKAGEPLRADVPDSVRDQILLTTRPELWWAWGALTEVVRTGAPARDPDTGLTAHESTLRDPAFAAVYRAARAGSGRTLGPAVAKCCDFTRFRTVADFGGDEGALLAAILAATPGLRGVLYDHPSGLGPAAATFAAAGVADRCELAEGDLAGPVPPGADAYLLNHVIRDRADAEAVQILASCRAAMAPAARLLLIETVLPPVLSPGDSASYGLTDLNGMVFTGGRERSLEEYRDLLGAAGLTLDAVIDVPTVGALPGYSVLEGVPKH